MTRRTVPFDTQALLLLRAHAHYANVGSYVSTEYGEKLHRLSSP